LLGGGAPKLDNGADAFDMKPPLTLGHALIFAAMVVAMCCQLAVLCRASALHHDADLRREAVRSGCTTVFSHRGRGVAPKKRLGSEAMLLAGIEGGVRAFDLDLTFTSDGTILVGHPSDVNEMDRFHVTELLDVASRMGENLTLALDLKGVERGAGFIDALSWLHAEVVRRRLQRSVWLWVPERAHHHARLMHREDLKHRGHRPPVLFGKPIYDIGAPRVGDEVDCSTQLTAEDAVVYTFLGPSVKCANARLLTSAHAAPFFERMHGWLPWVVDDEKMLRALHVAGMRSVISNIPTLLMERTAGLTFCN
jgi:hypothetical protein